MPPGRAPLGAVGPSQMCPSSSLFPFIPSGLLLSRCSRLSTQAHTEELPKQTIWKRKQQTICKLFPSSAASPIPKSPGRTGEDRERQHGNGRSVSGNVPSRPAAVPGKYGKAALLLGTAQGWQGTRSCFVPCELCPMELGAAGARRTRELLPLWFLSWLSPTLGGAGNFSPRTGKSFVVHPFLTSEVVAKMFLPPAGPTVPPGLRFPLELRRCPWALHT